jgi:carbon-monoxide dehydrogenase medium subunit
MKPAAFEYHAPASVDAMLELLERFGTDGKMLAGGQSLVPTMNFRLARPAHLLDLNGVAELDTLRALPDVLAIGALTRHAAFHRPVVDGPLGGLLADVVQHIAHYPIRQRGTFAGSLAHADPASEWCLVAATLGARIVARRRAGSRELDGGEFFSGIYSTELREDELIAEVRLPRMDAAWRCGFYEYSRRAGDFALGMTLAAVRLDSSGKISEARVGVGGIMDHPQRLKAVEDALLGQAPEAKLFAEAGNIASSVVDPMADHHASAEYRRDLVRATTRRALERAFA